MLATDNNTNNKKSLKSKVIGLARRASNKAKSGAKQVGTLARAATLKLKKPESQVANTQGQARRPQPYVPGVVYRSPDAPEEDVQVGNRTTNHLAPGNDGATHDRMRGLSLRAVSFNLEDSIESGHTGTTDNSR
ncbi:hypothetical protein H072_7407 [Dactylellina haptotyla CBS 200.50]|uniref:Uncharacterized protein n=1 Tax=Dactylellina haptotyla (strain CBS 200.50) TaxID=1284197 RepID=S8A7L2_DACHA|nr:hypothetical protein H072_7407 [Dactylellina haptotyla CBS 200.50]